MYFSYACASSDLHATKGKNMEFQKSTKTIFAHKNSTCFTL